MLCTGVKKNVAVCDPGRDAWGGAWIVFEQMCLVTYTNGQGQAQTERGRLVALAGQCVPVPLG
jgi:hypothetical protein